MKFHTKYILLLLVVVSSFKGLYSQNNSKNFNQLSELCRVWGYLKYFNKEVSQSNIDWDSVLVEILPEFYLNQSKSEFNSRLNKYLFISSNKKICGKKGHIPQELNWIDNSELLNDESKEILKNTLNNIPKTKRYVKLNSTARNCEFPNEKRYKNLDFPNREYQILTLFKYWNTIKYFYPYKYLMDNDWDSVLTEYLPEFYSYSNKETFHKLVFKLTTELRDTHVQTGSIVISNVMGYYFPYFYISYVNDNYVVSSFVNDSVKKNSLMQLGDIILAKDGIPISELDSNIRFYYKASNPLVTDKYIADWILLGTRDSVQLKLKRGNDTLINIVPRIYRVERQKLNDVKRKSSPCKIIQNDIGYINMGALYNNQIDSVYNIIRNTKGLIIDLREYPNETYYKLCSKLINKRKISFAKVNYPNLSIPGDFSGSLTLNVNGNKKDYYKGKVVLLIDENTQSQGEFSTMALECSPNVIKIGCQSAGADGNVSIINLPFGISTSFSGLRITYPDGRETQRIGIIPDIEVEKKYVDIASGKDTKLIFAINYLKNL